MFWIVYRWIWKQYVFLKINLDIFLKKDSEMFGWCQKSPYLCIRFLKKGAFLPSSFCIFIPSFFIKTSKYKYCFFGCYCVLRRTVYYIIMYHCAFSPLTFYYGNSLKHNWYPFNNFLNDCDFFLGCFGLASLKSLVFCESLLFVTFEISFTFVQPTGI